MPELPNKPMVAYNDGPYTFFVSWNDERIEFARWDRVSKHPSDIWQLPISSYSPTKKQDHDPV